MELIERPYKVKDNKKTLKIIYILIERVKKAVKKSPYKTSSKIILINC